MSDPDPLDALELLRTATEQARRRALEQTSRFNSDEALQIQARFEIAAIRHVGTLLARLRAAEAVCEAARQLLADPMYHDCRGPTCRLCGQLSESYDAWRAARGESDD